MHLIFRKFINLMTDPQVRTKRTRVSLFGSLQFLSLLLDLNLISSHLMNL